jgi:MEDS: MEthanogen/methylotroph, DcmR Sensory domain
MSACTRAGVGASRGFQHQALLYSGESGFVEGTVEFIQSGIAAGELILVAVATHKIDLLRRRLGNKADRVQWTDMTGIGVNPARIIPLWSQFLERHGGRGPVRGIGEPIWPERTATRS